MIDDGSQGAVTCGRQGMFIPDDPSKMPAGFDPNAFDHEAARQAIKDMFTPKGVELQVKQAVVLCWLIQSQENRTPDHVEALLRATFDKVLADLRADPRAFGVCEVPLEKFFEA